MIRLRDVEPGDRDKLLAWRNDPAVAQYLYTDRLIGPDEHARWFERALSSETSRYWIIVLDDEDVGLVSLNDIDRENSRCYWAFYLASPSTRGRGVGSWVEYTILNHVFDTLALNKLCCEVLAFNEAVVAMHQRFGFRQEGLFREHRWKQGKAQDVVCLAMLNREWLDARGPIEESLRAKGLI